VEASAQSEETETTSEDIDRPDDLARGERIGKPLVGMNNTASGIDSPHDNRFL
jgi:hypothetical protein